jgi:Type I site-specific restriction-modification system, R (restriction) subunit and related helicases
MQNLFWNGLISCIQSIRGHLHREWFVMIPMHKQSLMILRLRINRRTLQFQLIWWIRELMCRNVWIWLFF